MKKHLKKIWLLLLILLGGMIPSLAFLRAEEDFPEATPGFSEYSDQAYEWLVHQQDSALLDDHSGLSGLVDSFEDFSGPNTPITEAFTYDQALAAIAFLVKGDVPRAQIVLSTLQDLQADDGTWCNSYWYGGYWGAELRKHVGPAVWVALAVMNYESLTGDLTTYHDMAIAALDWSITFQQANGGIAGGMTTWDVPGVWTEEVWTGTEHNIDIYPALRYFASTTPSRGEIYDTAAEGVLSFLENIVWDEANQRFFGGYKNDTQLVDPYVPLDVNPWAVLALGTEYGSAIEYVENAAGDSLTGIGTLAHPKYIQTLIYDNEGNEMTGYDFDWRDDGALAEAKNGGGNYDADIWIEGTLFMASAYFALGNEEKATAILSEVVKKMGAGESLDGGLPYSLKASNNHYWRMLQQNCVSSTAWFVIAASQWNPFQGTPLNPLPQVLAPQTDRPAGQYASAIAIQLTSATPGCQIRYTTDGSEPTAESPLYSVAIPVADDMTIKTKAFADGMRPSPTETLFYVIDSQAQEPIFDLPSGTYSGPQMVSISTPTDGALIRYTTDGTLPTSTSAFYETPLFVEEDTTVTAAVFRNDLFASDYIRVVYVIQAKTAVPTLSLASGSFDEVQTVSILPPQEDAVIYYTLDESNPTADSPIYSGPIFLSGNVILKTAALVVGQGLSDVVSASYEIDLPSESFMWMETAGSTTIAWTDDFTYVDIHYFINHGGQQNVRMVVNPLTDQPEIILNSLQTGDEVEFWFTVMVAVQTDTPHYVFVQGENGTGLGTVAVPEADVVAGSYDHALEVTLVCSTPGAQIRYVINGDLDSAYILYTGPIRLLGSSVLSFYAVGEGMDSSEISSLLFQIDIEDELPDPFERILNIPAEPEDPEDPEDPIDTEEPEVPSDSDPRLKWTDIVWIVSGSAVTAIGSGIGIFFLIKKWRLRP